MWLETRGCQTPKRIKNIITAPDAIYEVFWNSRISLIEGQTKFKLFTKVLQDLLHLMMVSIQFYLMEKSSVKILLSISFYGTKKEENKLIEWHNNHNTNFWVNSLFHSFCGLFMNRVAIQQMAVVSSWSSSWAHCSKFGALGIFFKCHQHG